ncbi:MAG TPA: ATP-dependent DNA ligase [Acidimicrobiales bacterium]|nr:ATP-dependent DNA ligase [Acidimicrobiales bacterium]
MDLADLVATSAALSATRSRSAKIRALAELLRRIPDEEVAVVVGFLVGAPRQGRVGVGWSAVGRTIDVVPAAEPSLSVGDIDGAIDCLQQTTGPGSVGTRRRLLEDVFGRATEQEADFLRRLLMGELRQGALEGVMADAIAAAAGVPSATVRRAAMLAGDLPGVAATALEQGEAGLARIGLRLLQPVQPMLAATATTVAEALAVNGRSSVEWKLDGARVQAHRRGDSVRLFTRTLNDITDRLPAVADVVRALPASEVILDGEVFGAGLDEERAELFQDTMSSFSRAIPLPEAKLQVRFFDVLHLDGGDLIDRPLEERLVVLERVSGDHRVPGIVTADASEAEEFAADALARGHEGVMVKAASSRYEAGRRGSSWRKVKPVRTFDLVVLAAEWGHGRRRGWLSNLHLGARDPTTGSFVMVGKTFKGLTDKLLAWQTERFLELETKRAGIAVHIKAEVVVEVAVDGVQRSTRYPGGVALRFARVRRFRPDKAAAEADTIDAVRSMLGGAER